MKTFNDNAIGALEFTVTWEKDGIKHEEWFLGRKFNATNDIFPRGMRKALEGKTEGESVSFTYEPRLCIPRHKEKLVRDLPLDRLRPKTRYGQPIVPRLGRFYPQGHINGILDVYPDTLTPFRLIGLSDERFVADCNHPLALIPVTIEARIQYLEDRDTGTYGSLTHWRETTCDWGPGMQTMHEGHPTDFFHPDFFQRDDMTIEQTPPPPMDAKAYENIALLHQRHISPDMRVLNVANDRHTHVDGMYDAMLFTQIFEYHPAPIEALQDMATHLKPGGAVLIAFSNHYDERRAIKGWTELHAFERMGLILEYLRQAGLDTNAGTYSRRNDWRNKTEPDFLEKKGVSDPVFMVYGYKQS